MKTREVSVCIPLRAEAGELECLVISSRRHANRWVFPKGGVESAESSAQAGAREAWEEAGIKGTVLSTIAEGIPSGKVHKSDESVPKASYAIHILRVEQEEDTWPEKHERKRRWCSLEDALELTAWREEMSGGGRKALPDEAALLRLLQQSKA